MNFSVVNLGCKVNKVESDDAAALLLTAGWSESPQETAQLIVVNTCTVTGEADKKARKAVRHALRANSFCRVAVTGCAAAVNPDFYQNLDERVRVVPKASLHEALCEEMRAIDSACPTILNAGKAEDVLSMEGCDALRPANDVLFSQGGFPLRMGEGFRTRVGVKVQDGCDNACTYCIVHVARGRAVSRPADEVVAECVAYAQRGAREIVLSGINIGSYCDGPRHCFESVRIHHLLETLLRETEPFGEPPVRFRISSIEPRDVSPQLISLMAASDGRVCRHLHLPLQSGSEKVLREMARPYRAEDYLDLVTQMRSCMPTLSLSTDIIVGFPGETEADFEDTLAMARACAFSRIHVFPYSMRAGTPAAAREDQVPFEVKASRSARLRALGEELSADDIAKRRGSVEWALVEPDGTAVTESYHSFPAPEGSEPGSLIRMTI